MSKLAPTPKFPVDLNPPEIKTLKESLRRRFRGIMTPADNVLYFPKNLDVRICPKNGMSTLKIVLMDVRLKENPDRYNELELDWQAIGTRGARKYEIIHRAYMDDMPFRQGSTRIAIFRDPVDRFMGACNYIRQEYQSILDKYKIESMDDLTTEQLTRLAIISDMDLLPDDINDILEGVEKGEIVNTHFFPQWHYLGNKSQYTYIYNVRELGECLMYIQNHCKYNVDTTLRENKTEEKYYGTASDLDTKTRWRIENLYEEDYMYGWGKR